MSSSIALSPDGEAIGKMIKFKKLQWAILKVEKRYNEEADAEHEIYVPVRTFPIELKDLYSDEKKYEVHVKGSDSYPKTYKMGYLKKKNKDLEDPTEHFKEKMFPKFAKACEEELKVCCGFGLINVEYMDQKLETKYPEHCPILVSYCDDAVFEDPKEAKVHRQGKYMAASSKKNILTALAGFHYLEVNDVADLRDYDKYVAKCKKQ